MSDNNIVDMKQARKRQKEKQHQKQKKTQGGQADAGGKLGVLHWVQFVLFLLLMGYMMTLCRGG